MTVRAKFRYVSYQATHMSRPVDGNLSISIGTAEAKREYETVEARTMTFVPIYGANSSDENRLFWQATPSGELKLQMVNPEAWSQFAMGQCYYLDFSEAPND